ncbi:SCO family protein [Massilia glaciei]|uniref:SCO family protein n=1 Tax=Massilia glaciei TaxID=1524097 RepID=A0A2U2HNH7_9BURK|nr:SCO family protein [Massilia glaciei]
MLSACLAGNSLAAAPAPALKSGVFSPPRAAPEIALRGTDGSQFSLAKYRRKVVVLEFGYTACADVCPVSLAMLAQAKKQLGADGARLQVVFVTVDPARDSPAHLKRYMGAFDPSFIGITGTAAEMAAVQKAYGITVTKKMVEGAGGAYTMHHSSYLYFIDRQGMLRALMPFGRPAAEVVHDVKLLLKQ